MEINKPLIEKLTPNELNRWKVFQNIVEMVESGTITEKQGCEELKQLEIDYPK